MEISVLTGLPDLPEGLRWRVTKAAVGFYFTEISEVDVEIIREVQITTFTDRPLSWLNPFRKRVPATQTTIETVRSLGVRYEDGRIVKLAELTSAHVLKTATKVYDAWRLEEAGKGLLGEYPPKKLVVEE